MHGSLRRREEEKDFEIKERSFACAGGRGRGSTYQFIPIVFQEALVLPSVEVLVPNRGPPSDIYD